MDRHIAFVSKQCTQHQCSNNTNRWMHLCLFHMNLWKTDFAWLLVPNCGPWSLWCRCKTYRFKKGRKWGWWSIYKCPISETLSSLQNVPYCMPYVAFKHYSIWSHCNVVIFEPFSFEVHVFDSFKVLHMWSFKISSTKIELR
jgi:hypothetical protein